MVCDVCGASKPVKKILLFAGTRKKCCSTNCAKKVKLSESNIPVQFRYEGLCDFNGLYAAVVDYAKHYGYMWQEKAYKHKVPGPAGAEQEFVWILSRDVNEELSCNITLNVHAWDMKDMVVEGKPFTHLRLEIVFTSSMTIDPHKTFRSTQWARPLYNLYWRFRTRDFYLGPLDNFYVEVLGLRNRLMTFCDMKSNKSAY